MHNIIITTKYGTLSGTIESMNFFVLVLRTNDSLSRNIAKKNFLMCRHDSEDLIIQVPIHSNNKMPTYYNY